MAMARIWYALPFVALLTGCAVGVTHQYDNVTPTIATSGQVAELSVAVQDQRPYVLSGAKSQTFVGLSRGGFGNPFDVNTASGKALSDDMSRVVARALADSGTRAEIVAIAPREEEAAVIKKLAALNKRAVLVSVREWKSDTYMVVLLHYDVTVSVIDPDGHVAARKQIKGTDNLGFAGINPPELSRQVVPPAFRQKLEQLFSAPEIAAQI
jgi:hypothetical protein